MTKYYDVTPYNNYWGPDHLGAPPAGVVAGDYTAGVHFMLLDTGKIKGVRFYTAFAGTFKVSLWKPDGTQAKTITVARGIGTHDVEFSSEYQVTDADLATQERTGNKIWIVGVYDTSGTSFTAGDGSSRWFFEDFIATPGIGVHYQERNNRRSLGDNRPISTPGNDAFPIDPLFVPDSETREPMPFSKVYGPGNTSYGAVAVNRTVGVGFIALDLCTVYGGRFYTAVAGDFKVTLWKPDGTVAATKTINGLSTGLNEIPFDTPYVVTQTDIRQQVAAWTNPFKIGVYKIGGSHYTGAGTTDFLQLGGGSGGRAGLRSIYFPYHPVHYAAGDGIPTTFAGDQCPIDPIVEPHSETVDAQPCTRFSGANAPGLGFGFGNANGGGRFLVTAPCTITGVRFYSHRAVPHFINVRLWHPDGTMLQEKTVSMPSGAGEAVGTFDTPYVVTASDIEQQAHLVGVSQFMVSAYETGGNGFTYSANNRNLFLNGQTTVGRCYYLWDGPARTWGTPGNVRPVNDAGQNVPIDPVIVPTLTEDADLIDPVISNLSPAPGDINVSSTADIEFDLTDVGSGVDVNETIVRVNNVVVWSSDSQWSLWTGSKAPIAGGYRYTLTTPVPFTGVVTVYIFGKDIAGNDVETTYIFSPQITVDLVATVLSERVVRIAFGTSIARTAEARTAANYVVTGFSSGLEEVLVERVAIDESSPVLSYADLTLTQPVLYRKYKVTLSNLLILTGTTILPSDTTFVAHRTKIDSMAASLSRMYDIGVTSRSTVFAVLAAMGISDSDIGGETPGEDS